MRAWEFPFFLGKAGWLWNIKLDVSRLAGCYEFTLMIKLNPTIALTHLHWSIKWWRNTQAHGRRAVNKLADHGTGITTVTGIRWPLETPVYENQLRCFR